MKKYEKKGEGSEKTDLVTARAFSRYPYGTGDPVPRAPGPSVYHHPFLLMRYG
ncbi:hypothetical protein Holit_00310 [Hollandina sp. SP2]